MTGLLLAYLPALALTLYFAYTANTGGPDNMLLVGFVGTVLMLYLMILVVVSGVLFAGSTGSLLRCAGLHFAFITAGVAVCMRHPVALLYGLAGGRCPWPPPVLPLWCGISLPADCHRPVCVCHGLRIRHLPRHSAKALEASPPP